jgi:hypothetical protein
MRSPVVIAANAPRCLLIRTSSIARVSADSIAVSFAIGVFFKPAN